MPPIELLSTVGPDDRLQVKLPAGLAGQRVRVTVTADASGDIIPPPMSQEEWIAFIDRTGGSITDPAFRRYDQGVAEERDPL